MSRRNMKFEVTDMPDYGNLPRPMIEVFTIDSDTCAACTYMFRSAMDEKETFESIIPGRFLQFRRLPSSPLPGGYRLAP